MSSVCIYEINRLNFCRLSFTGLEDVRVAALLADENFRENHRRYKKAPMASPGLFFSMDGGGEIVFRVTL